MHKLNWLLILCLMRNVSPKSEKAKRVGNVPADGVDLQWEPLVLEEDDHIHTRFSTLSVSTTTFFTTTTQ